jgi:SAM-dependent MidA family methyltransferase
MVHDGVKTIRGYNLPYSSDIPFMASLPAPTPDQLAHSENLIAAIRADIEANSGWISFARYMELALYAPGLGYYSAGSQKFGASGDFVTAPEISPLFGWTLARQAAQVLREVGGDVLELGAGTGRLAAQMLPELQRLEALPQRYRILEVSAHLRGVQRENLEALLPDGLFQRVEWLEALPDSVNGFAFGNEVLDALPVHIVNWREGGLCERGVVWRDGRLAFEDRPLAGGWLEETARNMTMPAGYVSEICPAASALIGSLAGTLQQGALLLIDYGFPRREYYHPQRMTGTLMCHYRQHAHDDPLLYPGLQDITAHVDFTTTAEAGVAHGLELIGYTSQARFLINCGITDLLAATSPSDMGAYLPLVTQMQKLISPAEMGELFKVVAFGKGVGPMQGFAQGDKRHTL